MYELFESFPYGNLIKRNFPLTYIQRQVALAKLRPSLEVIKGDETIEKIDRDQIYVSDGTVEDNVTALMVQCWKQKPAERMTFSDIQATLSSYLVEYKREKSVYGQTFTEIPDVSIIDEELAVGVLKSVNIKAGPIADSGGSFEVSSMVKESGGYEESTVVQCQLKLPKELQVYRIPDCSRYALTLPIINVSKLSDSEGKIFENLRFFFKLHVKRHDIWLKFNGISVIESQLILCAEHGCKLSCVPDLIPAIETWIQVLKVLDLLHESDQGLMIDTPDLDNLYVDGSGNVRLNMWDVLMRRDGFGCTDSLKMRSLSAVDYVAPEVREDPSTRCIKSFVFTIAWRINHHVKTMTSAQSEVVLKNMDRDARNRMTPGDFASKLESL